MTEKELARFVQDAAKTFGWRRYHTHRSDFSPAGFPDETLLRGDRLVFAELKSESGKVSPLQQEWLDELAQVRSVTAHLWRPVDCDDLVRVLR
jgi:hypothetical protein